MNEFEKMRNGLLYNPSSSDIADYHIHGVEGCQKYNQIPFSKKKEKEEVLNDLIPSSKGKNLEIFAPFYCEYGVNIEVGQNCYCNFNCTFLDVGKITLGDGVWLGANVTLATPMHPFLADERLPREYPDGFHDLEYAKPITIQDHCWICSGVTICGGVTIGENSIVAAGAVVTKDMPANSLIGGVPAHVIRSLDENDRMEAWDTYQKGELPLSKREKEK